MSLSTPETSVDLTLEIPEGICVLCHASIDVDQVIKSVQDDRAGATAVFIGTTRNSFKGKTVTRLEYQAYSKLAIKTMASAIRTAATSISRSDHYPDSQKVRSLIHCAVHHRLGTVPVSEPSIGKIIRGTGIDFYNVLLVIAVSSPHRKEAFTACELILEEVKHKAQIWKREYYEGEDESKAEWKANEQ